MTMRFWIRATVFPVAIAVLATTGQAQGKGKGQGAAKSEQKQDHAQPKAEKQNGKSDRGPGQTVSQRGRSSSVGQTRAEENHAEHAVPARGNAGAKAVPASPNASPRARVAVASNRGRDFRFARDLTESEVRPSVKKFVLSNRPAEFVTGGAISYALVRGIPENALVITPNGRDVLVRNRKGNPLLAIDDDRARNLGGWQVSPLAEPVKDGAPSFCRSGEGHPVWGRQWCLQKGFGLGDSPNTRWAAARDIGDLTWVAPVAGPLTRDALLNLIGPVAFDRLALHALTLGYTDPLTGVWRTDASGPSLLLVNSGSYPIAELLDSNRDQRPDLMLVALRPW
ncbi:MAG TPA: hypothetical protein VJ865_12440 [Gemmatimonadaceae bacterium]|nr:hypothetical protein [Gemmatimonadaceae bacterium]